MADDANTPPNASNPAGSGGEAPKPESAAEAALKAAQDAIAGLGDLTGAAPPPAPAPKPASSSGAGALADAALKAAQDAISGLAGGLGMDDVAAAPAGDGGQVDYEALMQAAIEEEKAEKLKAKTPPGATPMPLPSLTANLSPAQQKAIELLSDVNLNVKIELGRTRMLVEDVLKLSEGAVVELDKLAGDPVDIFVNDRHVARGEVLVLNDNFCVRVSEILQQVGDPATAVAKPV